MTKPWHTIDRRATPDGLLELRQRSDRDFLILINGRVLMNSRANRSERALGDLACRAVAGRPAPRILIGGLGMALTLRAALDALPAAARITVAELNPVVVSWCRGPLAELTERAVEDPRVSVVVDDVSRMVRQAGERGYGSYDAIVIDLYEGPHAKIDQQNDPFYGARAIQNSLRALSDGGVFAIWGEAPDRTFEKRLEAAGFSIERLRPGKGGLRHVVYVAKKEGPSGQGRRSRSH